MKNCIQTKREIKIDSEQLPLTYVITASNWKSIITERHNFFVFIYDTASDLCAWIFATFRRQKCHCHKIVGPFQVRFTFFARRTVHFQIVFTTISSEFLHSDGTCVLTRFFAGKLALLLFRLMIAIGVWRINAHGAAHASISVRNHRWQHNNFRLAAERIKCK